MHARDVISRLSWSIGVILTFTTQGCQPYSDVSNDPSRGYNFSTLVKGHRFRTTTASYLISADIPYLSPPGTVMTPDAPTTSSLQEFKEHHQPGHWPNLEYVFPAGVEFEVSKLLVENGDTGDFVLIAVIKTGEKAGLSVNALDFFTSGNYTEFIIGPYITPCDVKINKSGTN